MYLVKFYKILFLFLFLLSSCIYEKEEKLVDVVVAGDVMPSFNVIDNKGNNVNSKDFIGKVSFITFFHTQCPDCVYELPICQQIYNKYVGEDLAFLCISREEAFSEVQDYWNINSFTMPFSAQEDRLVYNMFARSGIPFVVIADKKGVIRFIYNDKDMPNYNQLEMDIDLLIGDRIL